jgi:hypothetical protein
MELTTATRKLCEWSYLTSVGRRIFQILCKRTYVCTERLCKYIAIKYPDIKNLYHATYTFVKKVIVQWKASNRMFYRFLKTEEEWISRQHILLSTDTTETIRTETKNICRSPTRLPIRQLPNKLIKKTEKYLENVIVVKCREWTQTPTYSITYLFRQTQ